MPRNLPGTERLTRASATMTDCRDAVCQPRMKQEEGGGGFRQTAARLYQRRIGLGVWGR